MFAELRWTVDKGIHDQSAGRCQCVPALNGLDPDTSCNPTPATLLLDSDLSGHPYVRQNNRRISMVFSHHYMETF